MALSTNSNDSNDLLFNSITGTDNGLAPGNYLYQVQFGYILLPAGFG